MSEDLYMLLTRGVYGSTKDCIRHWLVCSRREDSLRLGKALLRSIDLIVIGFQPIVKGRAKIMQGVDVRIKLYYTYKFIGADGYQ